MNGNIWEALGEPDPLCPQCGGDGYEERFNDDQTDVVITPCSSCYPTDFEGQ